MKQPDKKQKKSKKPAKESGVSKGFFSGGWLASKFIQRQRWYILFVFGLALFYISYRFYAEQTILKAQKLEAEVKALQVDYIIQSEKLTKVYKRSEIIKKAQQKGLGLVEPEEPPKRIKAD